MPLLSNSSTLVPPPHLKLGDTLGIIFIANIVAAIFYGLTTIQVYIYCSHNAEDPLLFKIFIPVLWLLDTTHLVLITDVVYHYSISNFDNPLALLVVPATIGVHIVIAGLSDVLVRSIYTYRVWKFSGRNIPLAAAISSITFLAFLGSPALAAVSIKIKVLSKFPAFSWLVYCTFIAGAFADVSIATSLCFLLWRRRTGFRSTDSLINTLMLYTINTGALTSCISIASVITFATMPNNLVFLAILFILPKLLLNSLLANLNGRRALKNRDTSDLLSVRLSTIGPSSPRPVNESQDEPALAIKVENTTYQTVDDMSLRSIQHAAQVDMA